jgi:hypothetical protein
MARSTCLGSPNASKLRYLQASTSEVYGDPEVHPQTVGYWGRAIRWVRGPARTNCHLLSSLTAVAPEAALALPRKINKARLRQ